VSLALLSIVEMELVSETLFDQLEMAVSLEDCTKAIPKSTPNWLVKKYKI